MTMISPPNQLQRRDMAKFRALADSFIEADPSRSNNFASDMARTLSVMPKKVFVACVEDLLQSAFSAPPHLVPAYLQIFNHLKNVSTRLDSGQFFPISQAISGYCMKHPSEYATVQDLEIFRKKLPLLNELYERNLIQRGYFKFFAKMFANCRKGEVAMAFLYEILHNVNWLNDCGTFEKMEQSEEDFWANCTFVLSEACRKNVINDRVLFANVQSLLETIRKKGKGGSRDLTTPLISEAEKGSSPSGGDHQTPLPNVSEQDLSEIRLVMRSLTRSPDQLARCAKQIQHILENYSATSKEAFYAGIDELLNEILHADAQTFANSVLLLEHLLKTLPPVLLRRAISLSATQIHRLETEEHVFEFCASFKLSNQLCRLGLLPASIFKQYVNELAKLEKDLSYLFIFEVLKNVDRLIDEGVATLNAAEVNFWECSTERLARALSNRRLVSTEKAKQIGVFFDQLKQKGGWNRMRQQPTTTNAQPKGQLVTLPIIPAATKITPQKPENSLPVVANMTEDIDFRVLIDAVSLLGNVEATARLFKSKLNSISAPFFTESVEIVLAKIFLQIDSEPSLDAAAKLCIAFNKQEYGCGKNFMLELQKACLKYLSTQCRSDMERVKAQFQSAMENAPTPQMQVTLAQEINQLESVFRRKNTGCIRLVAKLFEVEKLNFSFLLSVVDSLLARRSEDAMDCLLELFNRIGKEFERQVNDSKNMAAWWNNLFEELTDIGQLPTSSQKLKTIVAEILLAKTKGWPSVDSKQLAVKRMQILMKELTPELIRQPHEFAATVNRVRAFALSPEEAIGTPQLVDAFLARIQECVAENERLLQKLASQEQVVNHSSVTVTGQQVRLPAAAPKPRKPSRWDQAPASAETPVTHSANGFLAKVYDNQLPASNWIQQTPPVGPSPQVANQTLQQLLTAMGGLQQQQHLPVAPIVPTVPTVVAQQQSNGNNKPKPLPLASLQQQVGDQNGNQFTNAFEALKAAALSIPSLPSPSSVAAAIHRMWPGMVGVADPNPNPNKPNQFNYYPPAAVSVDRLQPLTPVSSVFEQGGQKIAPMVKPLGQNNGQQRITIKLTSGKVLSDYAAMPPPAANNKKSSPANNSNNQSNGTKSSNSSKKSNSPIPIDYRQLSASSAKNGSSMKKHSPGNKSSGKSPVKIQPNSLQKVTIKIEPSPEPPKKQSPTVRFAVGSAEKDGRNSLLNASSSKQKRNHPSPKTLADAFGSLSISRQFRRERRLSSSGSSSTVSIDTPEQDVSLLADFELIPNNASCFSPSQSDENSGANPPPNADE